MTKGCFCCVTLPDGFHAVCWRPEEHQDWLQIVARFRDKGRAEAYAEVEDMLIHEEGFETGDDIKLLPPPISEPESKISPHRFRLPNGLGHRPKKPAVSSDDAQRAVLKVMAENMDANNLVEMSMAKIGELSNAPSVQFAISALIEKKAIMIARPAKHGTGGYPTTYQVLAPSLTSLLGVLPGDTVEIVKPQ